MDRETFVSTVLDNMPLAPTYYPELKKVNKVGPVLTTALADGSPLTASSVAAMQQEGALVVDTRGTDAFGEGHIPGALAVGWGSNFLTWIGWIAPYDRDLILVLEDDATYEEAVTELRRIGLDRVAGYLQGGMSAWTAADLPTVSLAQITVTELADRLQAGEPDLAVLDVRRPDEWESGHIATADHAYVGTMAQGKRLAINDERKTAIICGTGYRSLVAASLLQQQGHTNLINVVGGMTAWDDAELPVVQ
jgi:hydroxyacylglutathione hydrolase